MTDTTSVSTPIPVRPRPSPVPSPIDASRWAARMKSNPKLLAPYFRALAESFETNSFAAYDGYKKANPDYPHDIPSVGAPPWQAIIALVIAVLQLLKPIVK